MPGIDRTGSRLRCIGRGGSSGRALERGIARRFICGVTGQASGLIVRCVCLDIAMGIMTAYAIESVAAACVATAPRERCPLEANRRRIAPLDPLPPWAVAPGAKLNDLRPATRLGRAMAGSGKRAATASM